MFCSLNFTCMLCGAARSLNLTCMLQYRMLWVASTLLGCCNSRCREFFVRSWLELHIQFLYFYNIFICKCWTWICVSYSFSEFKHLHTQIFALWDTLGFNSFFKLFSWNLLLELDYGFRIFCWVWISNSRDFEVFIINEFKEDKKKKLKEKKIINKEKKFFEKKKEN